MRAEIVCCPLDRWFGAYHTFEPTEAELATCTNALEAKLQVQEETQTRSRAEHSIQKAGKFVQFKTPPSRRRETEDRVFAPLKDIADCLGTVDLDVANVTAEMDRSVSQNESAKLHRHSRTHWTYASSPDGALPGEQAGGSNRVGGYFHRSSLHGELSLADVAVLCEYKKKGEDAVQNRRQLFHAAAHLFNRDPVRFAVYGITIEDCEVSLWYFCRSHTAKSESFNFVENPITLVRVFISFMFAHSESLGFDGDIRRVLPSPTDGRLSTSYVYRFTVDDNGEERVHYRTRQTICGSRRPYVAGRATRVWEAEQVKSFDDLERVDNKVVVLREVWLDEDTPTELQIQRSIFASLDIFGNKLKKDPGYSPPGFSRFDDDLKGGVRALFEEDDTSPPTSSGTRERRKVYEKYFLTIKEDCLGVLTRGVATDYQTDPTLLRQLKKRNTIPNPPRDNTPPRRFCRRRPYRLIYEERCLDLVDEALTSLKDLFTGLQGCFTALVLMFCAGWVHRDISGGNVLIWTDPEGKKHGKLGDLEYAKPFPSESGSPGTKVGTAYFIPVEVAEGYRVASKAETATGMNSKWPRLDDSLTAAERESALREFLSQHKGRIPPRTEEEDPLQHHFTHDLECIWWLTLWSVTCRLGNWDGVSFVFNPNISNQATLLRKRFLMYDNRDLLALAEELPESLQTVHLYLMASREYLRFRFLELAELDEKARADPAAHSRPFMSLRRLVNVDIPPDAPPLVDSSNPFWRPVAESELEKLEDQALKRSHPDS